jgi:hypothetical protein
MVPPKEEIGPRGIPTRIRLHPMGDKSGRLNMVDPSKAKDIVNGRLLDMANKRVVMDARRSPLVDTGGPITGRRNTSLLTAKKKDMVARGKTVMADLLVTSPNLVTRMGSKE